MKFLVVLSVIAAAAAHPLPEDCDHAVLVPGAVPYAAPVAPWAHVGATHLTQYAASPYSQVAHVHPHPAHIVYAAPTPVALPPREVKIPVTHTHVEVPIHQQVHYGTQNYVAGAATAIHKPSLSAPAIAPPSVLLSKITHNAPEVTVQRQEVPVERHSPNFVDTPYHAGTIIKYTEPEVREVKVATPYAQPIPVAHPVPVPVPHAVPTPVHSVAVHAAPVPVQAVHPITYQAVVAADDC